MKFLPASALFLLITQSINAIEISDRELVFENAAEGSAVEFRVEIKNDAGHVLQAGLRPSCDCVTVDKNRISLEPGSMESIKVSVDTSGYSGEFLKQLFVQSNDQDDPYITVNIRGNVGGKAPPGVQPQKPERRNEDGAGARVIPVVLFDSAGCLFCRRLKDNLIPPLEKKYAVTVKVQEYDVSLPENFKKLIMLEKKHRITSDKFPVLFVGADAVAGKEEIVKNLPQLLEKYSNDPPGNIEVPLSGDEGLLQAEGRLKLFPVLAAGLIDSVNPCAFATIIFFLSYLSLVLKKQRSEILVIGLVFISGAFVSYLLIGIGLFKSVQSLAAVSVLSKVLYALMGILALYLAYRHFYEALLIRRSGSIPERGIKLKLPERFRLKIYDMIRHMTQTRYVIPLVFVSAAAVTFLEFFCTGQVYLPTIVYLVSLNVFNKTALIFLILYCILFVLPLIVIFILFYCGMTTEKLKRFFAKEMVSAKIAMSLFFLVLAFLMFRSFWF